MLTFLAQRQSLTVIYRRGTNIQASNLAGKLKRKDSATADLDGLSASTTEKSSDMLSVTKVTGTRLGTAADDISLQSYWQQSALASRPFRRPPLFLTHSGLDLSVREDDVPVNLDSPCLCFGKVIYE